MKLLIRVLIFLFLANILMARYPESQAGLDFSTISGAGLSYQMEIDRHKAFKITGFPYYFGESISDHDFQIYWIFGGNFQWNIDKTENSRVYTFIGASIWYLEDRYIDVQIVDDIPIETRKTDIDRIFNYGIGIGYEYTYAKAVSFSVELGLQRQVSSPSGYAYLIDRNPRGTVYNGFGASTGVKFRL